MQTKWRQIEEMFHAVLEIPPQQRASFLEAQCGDNAELRSEIEKLVAALSDSDEQIVDSLTEAAANLVSEKEPLRFGKYSVVRVLGHGGMGSVYLAVRNDDQYRQQVAVKFIPTGFAGPEMILRFRTERQILAMLSHPNIARLLDGGVTSDGVPYLVMEYIEGRPIDRFIDERHLSIPERLELFLRVCEAVQYAHQNLIVHRDIKPGNVLVTSDGQPKLLDFGIAKLLEPGTVGQTVPLTARTERLMTPGYASPEQIRGENITTATDVYALGVLLYEMLAGKPAFETANLTPSAIERLVCETQPPRPSTVTAESIPPDLDNIVQKAMQREPARRYHSAGDLAADVTRYLTGYPVSARPDSLWYRTSKFVTRHAWGVSAAALVLTVVSALGVGLVVESSRARREARTSERVSAFLASLFQFSRPQVAQGRNISAREILDAGAQRIPRELANDPEVEARLLATVGRVYYSVGALDRAEEIGKQALGLSRRVLGEDSLTEAEAAGHILGLVAAGRGKYDEAENYYRDALRIFSRRQGPQSHEVAGILNNIAIAEKRQQKWAAAEADFKRAIQIYSATTGPKSDGALMAKSNLALLFLQSGDYARADPLSREVLAERIKTLGLRYPSVAISTGNLADVEEGEGRLKDAEATARLALERYRAAYGPGNWMLLNVINDLATIEGEEGKYQEALSLISQDLDMSAKLTGPRSDTTATVICTRARILLGMGDVRGARETVDRGMSIAPVAFAPDDTRLGQMLDARAEIELREGNPDAAVKDARKCLEIEEKHFGHKGVDVASALIILGDVARARGDYSDAIAQYQDAIAAERTRWQGPHPVTARALFGLGRAELAEGRVHEATSDLQKALDMRRELLPPGHPDIAATVAALAECSQATRTTPPSR